MPTFRSCCSVDNLTYSILFRSKLP